MSDTKCDCDEGIHDLECPTRPPPLKVGDVCKDPAQLRAGMTVRCRVWPDPTDVIVLKRRSNALDRGNGWWATKQGHGISDVEVEQHGASILALPEEAPVPQLGAYAAYGEGLKAKYAAMEAAAFPLPEEAPIDATGMNAQPPLLCPAERTFNRLMVEARAAAPSLESVPVGSRWRWDEYGATNIWGDSAGAPDLTVVSTDKEHVVYRYGDSTLTHRSVHNVFLAHATRIDEPAGAGQYVPMQLCGLDGCARAHGHEGIHVFPATLTKPLRFSQPPPAPAMPPARCAPGCTPSKSCRITIPVTDKGTRYECPAFAEDKVKYGAMVLDHVDSQARDRYEARAMRDQRWEAMNAGPMVGRYRFNLR